MSTINKVTGKAYRICKDAVNKIWDEISFLTYSGDVTFDDNMTAEQKVGAIKGLATTEQSTPGYVMDASVAVVAPKLLTGALNIGATSLTWTSPSITNTARIVSYTDHWGVTPKKQTVSNNVLTLEFDPQDEVILVKVEVGEFHS